MTSFWICNVLAFDVIYVLIGTTPVSSLSYDSSLLFISSVNFNCKGNWSIYGGSFPFECGLLDFKCPVKWYFVTYWADFFSGPLWGIYNNSPLYWFPIYPW